MCPNSKISYKKPEKMSISLFNKILEEILQEDLQFTQIYLYLQNEPLMDSDIFNKLKLIKKISKGRIFTGLVTNGTLFTYKKIEELIKSEIDDIVISVDAYSEKTYKEIRQGLNFNKVIKNIENIIDSSYNKHIEVKFVLQKNNISEFKYFKKFWKRKGIPILISLLNNRSGNLLSYYNLCLKNKEIPYKLRFKNNIGRMTNRGCHYPFINFNILYNGDVILCCNDYSGKKILGNVNVSSIKEIWNSKKYQRIRELFYKKKYEKIFLCQTCTKIRK
jgi:radical SAM protein with 4Fe4S-binding SPASM domain